MIRRGDDFYRVHVRSSQGRRRAKLSVARAAIRAGLLASAAAAIATFVFVLGVMRASV